MLRSFHLPIVSFCILLTFANCENNCQNLPNGDELAELRNQYLTVFNQNQELSKQIYEIVDQRDVIFRATQDLNQALQDLDKLNALIADLGPIREDLELINEKLAKTATKEQLDGVKKDLEGRIKANKDQLDAVREQLQKDIEKSKAEAIEEATKLAKAMVEAMKEALKAQKESEEQAARSASRLKVEGHSDPNQFEKEALDKVLLLKKEVERIDGQLGTVRSIAKEARKAAKDKTNVRNFNRRVNSRQQPPVTSNPATRQGNTGPSASDADRLSPYAWTNGEVEGLLNALHELQQNMKRFGVKVRRNINKINNPNNPTYEDRLKKLKEEIEQIKQKEQAVDDTDKVIRTLAKLLNSLNSGSWRVMSKRGSYLDLEELSKRLGDDK